MSEDQTPLERPDVCAICGGKSEMEFNCMTRYGLLSAQLCLGCWRKGPSDEARAGEIIIKRLRELLGKDSTHFVKYVLRGYVEKETAECLKSKLH